MSDYDLLMWLIVIAAALFITGEVQSIITLRQTAKVYDLTRKDDETYPGN